MKGGSRALAGLIGSTAAPYGYTVTLWSTGALLIHFHGNPKVWEVFLFAAGAVGGFFILGAAARRLGKDPDGVDHPSARIVAGMANWVAVGLAVGAAALLAEIPSWVAWPIGAAAATVLYLAAAAVQLLIAARISDAKENP